MPFHTELRQLPENAFSTDLALQKTLRVCHQQVETLIAFPGTVEQFAEVLQRNVLRELNLTDSIRRVSKKNVETLIAFLQEQGTKKLAFRHGEQHHTFSTLLDSASEIQKAEHKIRMMKGYYNRSDPLTDRSKAHAASLWPLLMYAGLLTGNEIVVRTSPNARASQVAALSRMFAMTPVIDPRLACIEYKRDVTPHSIGINADGTVSWNKDAVDRLAGKGTYERVSQDVREMIEETGSPLNRLTIEITHTQQLDELMHQYGVGEGNTRVATYGFFAYLQNRAYTEPTGLFATS